MKEKAKMNKVQITLEEGVEFPDKLPEFEKQIRECFRDNKFNIEIDLSNIKLPPTKFIVTLIELTSQARRMGGDLKLTNLNFSVRNNFVTFSPRTYLSLEDSEKYALLDFGETVDSVSSFDKKDDQNPDHLQNKTQNQIAVKQKNSEINAPDIDLESIDLNSLEKVQVRSKVDNLYEICDFVLERAEAAGFDIRERGKIKVTVYEACLNVVEHAYFSNPDHLINVYVSFDEQKFIIIIQDWGESFEFDPNRSYDVEQAVKDRKTGGFGLHIMKRSVDKIIYLSSEELGNRLILIKNVPAIS